MDEDGAIIPLTTSNIATIKLNNNELELNEDGILLFNKSNENGSYVYEITTIQNKTYEITLVYVKEFAKIDNARVAYDFVE